MELFFIVNPKAGKAKRIWRQLQRTLTVSYQVHNTRAEGDATVITKQLAQSNRPYLIIGVGGDGTMHEIVQGALHAKNIIIGYVPAGSGNDFARAFPTFHHAHEIEHFMQQVQPTIHTFDSGVMQVDDEVHCFVNNAGLGFDAYVATLVNQSKWKRLFNHLRIGRFLYFFAVIRALLHYKTFSATITSDGKTIHYKDIWFIALCNQPYFGGGMKVAPHAVPHDGYLQVVVVNKVSRLKLLLVFSSVFIGWHTFFKEVSIMQATTMAITITQGDAPAHVDGEKLANQSVDATIIGQIKPRCWQSVRFTANHHI